MTFLLIIDVILITVPKLIMAKSGCIAMNFALAKFVCSHGE
jgi:hypothetical protein